MKNKTEVPERTENSNERKQKLPLSFYLSVVTAAISIVLLVLNTVKQDYTNVYLRYVSVAFICLYVIAFAGVVIYALVKKQRMKSELATVKTVGKGFKITMKILNKVIVFVNLLSAAALAFVEIKEGAVSFRTYILAVVSVFSVISVVLFFVKSGKKLKKLHDKDKKQREKARKQ